MDLQLFSISYSDPVWLVVAFMFGLAMRLVHLPPMVGFLVAGFVLSALGAKSGAFLQSVSDIGITLLLFSIGLKLKLKSLARPEVWSVATLHMGAITLFFAFVVLVFSYTSLPLFAELDWEGALLIGFVLSFSSTVFAVKILDEFGATSALHGKITIGVLVVQDVVAVLFIAVSMGKMPSIFALALICLLPLRFVLLRVLERVGHGELLVLFGITLALVGTDIFAAVGIKKDVGALVFGMLLAQHPKANELAKSLLGFKELFLVGFFLSVGMKGGMPSVTEFSIGLLLLCLVPIKTALFYGLFTRFYLRASTAWRTSLGLSNYSEFGLIVGALAVTAGWLSTEWLVVFAVVMSGSFILLAFSIGARDLLFEKWHTWLRLFERHKRLREEEHLELAHIQIVIFGVGRTGSAVYDAMKEKYDGYLVGVELEPERATQHVAAGRDVVIGDATSPDFWDRAPALLDDLQWVLLTLPTHAANTNATVQIRRMGYTGLIAATTKYPDEAAALKLAGVDHTFNVYSEAGLGFASELLTGDENIPKSNGAPNAT